MSKSKTSNSMFWVIFKHCKSMLTMKVIYFSAKIQSHFLTAKHISFEIDGIFLMYFFAYKNIFMFISIKVSIGIHFKKIRIQNWLWIFAKKNHWQFSFKSVLGFHFFQQNSFQFLAPKFKFFKLFQHKNTRFSSEFWSISIQICFTIPFLIQIMNFRRKNSKSIFLQIQFWIKVE